MNIIEISFIVLSCIAGLFILIFAFKTKKPFKTLFSSALLGVSSLFIVSMTGGITGIQVAMNVFTLTTSAVLGLPGVIAIILTKTIWHI
jgi:pro-sigmaK processing inhibitor BofA